MAAETITLVLDGDIGLDDYQTAIKSLRDLVHELHEAVAPGAVIDWYIERLDTGSAVTTLRAEAEDSAALGSISAAYLSIGEAIEGNRPIPYGQRIQYPALTIANLIDGRVTGVRFETALAEAIIHEQTQRNRIVQEPKLVSRGAVEGVIQIICVPSECLAHQGATLCTTRSTIVLCPATYARSRTRSCAMSGGSGRSWKA